MLLMFKSTLTADRNRDTARFLALRYFLDQINAKQTLRQAGSGDLHVLWNGKAQLEIVSGNAAVDPAGVLFPRLARRFL